MKKEKISAIIFAAGLGTRLYPITKNRPKALVKYKDKVLLENAIETIIAHGIHHIVINVHHFAEQIIAFVKQQKYDATIEISHEKEMLMDTAGGLKMAAPFFHDCDHILMYNVDIISTINLSKLIAVHCDSNALATLAVKNRETSRYFLFDAENLSLSGWENVKSGEQIIVREAASYEPFAFSGIHIAKKELLSFIPNNKKYSITPLYLEACKNNLILGYLHQEDEWEDIGKIEISGQLLS